MNNKIYTDVEQMLGFIIDTTLDLNIEPLMRQWRHSKARFIELFGGQTRIRSPEPIEFNLTQEQKEQNLRDCYDELDAENLLDEETKKFLILNEKSFFENRVTDSSLNPSLAVGAKLSKSLHHFLPQEKLVKAQTIISRYIQKNKLKGYLYFSVDPRDFLTLSENNESWTSCLSFHLSHCAGTLSMMVDDSTLIAFVANEKEEPLISFAKTVTGYSKKWRALIHLNQENMLWINRHYPFKLETLSTLVRSYFPLDFKYSYKGTAENINTDFFLGFCDFTESDMNEIEVLTTAPVTLPKPPSLSIGNIPKCPLCGTGIIAATNTLLCEYCEEFMI